MVVQRRDVVWLGGQPAIDQSRQELEQPVGDGARARLEQLVEADVTEWARIKSSKKIDDWVSYLQTFPNGRFAEIAQLRLARLLAEDEKLAAEKRQREEQQWLE